MSGSIEAVIFDLDGVLIDSAEAHYQSWRQLADRLGRSVTREQFKQTFGRPNSDILPRLFGDDLSPEEILGLGEEKERLYRRIVGAHVRAIDGAVELVTACHGAGLKCAVGSSGHPLNIDLALTALGIKGLIGGVVTGHDVRKGKPDPEVFLTAAGEVGVAPARCVVIEDAPAGIEAALAAGMFAVGVATEHAPEQLERAHLVAPSPRQLSPAALQALPAGVA